MYHSMVNYLTPLVTGLPGVQSGYREDRRWSSASFGSLGRSLGRHSVTSPVRTHGQRELLDV